MRLRRTNTYYAPQKHIKYIRKLAMQQMSAQVKVEDASMGKEFVAGVKRS